MPVMAPPLNATLSAGPMPLVAACAVRTLARTDTFMPDEAAGARQHRAEHVAAGRLGAEEEEDDDGEHHADDGDGAVLTREIGCGALLDGGRDLLHAGVARVLLQDPGTLDEPVEHGEDAAGERDFQRQSR